MAAVRILMQRLITGYYVQALRELFLIYSCGRSRFSREYANFIIKEDRQLEIQINWIYRTLSEGEEVLHYSYNKATMYLSILLFHFQTKSIPARYSNAK